MIKPEFDGKTFRYPGAARVQSFRDVARWAMTRRPARWPAHVSNPPADPVEERVHGTALRVTYINHSTVLIQTQGQNILTDPVFSRRVSPVRFAGPARHRDPGVALENLPPIDTVLISHCHYDHLDLASLKRLQARDAPQIIAPLANAPIIARAGCSGTVELSWWDSHALSERIQVSLVPARHWSSRSLGDANRALWGGFVISLEAGAVYFAGDTGYGDGSQFTEARQHLGPFRLALLPIGAYEPRWFMQAQHMNPAEAVRACLDLQAQFAMAIHFGTFQLTDEAIDAPEQALADALAGQPTLADRFRVLANGQAWDL